MVGKLLIAIVVSLAISASFADVIMDDFNDAYPGQTTLGQGLGTTAHSGYWYGFSDVKDGGTSTITPDVITADTSFTQAVVPEGSDGSKCLHVTMNLKTTISYPYAAVGFEINTTALQWIDLTAMTSITFMAKGSGALRVKFMTDKVTNGYASGQNWGDMGAEVSLTSAWKTYTIAVADIKPQPYSPQETDNLTWADCRNKVNKIHFQTAPSMTGGSIFDLYLDDLAMQGVTLQTFGGSSPVAYRMPAPKPTRMDVSAHANSIAIILPSQETITADLYSLNGSFIQRLFSGTAQKAIIPVRASDGNYIAVIEGNVRRSSVPVTILKR
jgi:hypothetical protein